MAKSWFGLLFVAIVVAGIFSSYQIRQDSLRLEGLLKDDFDQRVTRFKEDQARKCRERTLEDAEAFVDSIIIEQINVEVLGNLVFPEKPIKPTFPENITLDDTTLVISTKSLSREK